MMKIFSQPFFVLLFFVNDSKRLVPLLSGTEMVGSSTKGLGHYGYSEPRILPLKLGLLLNSGRQAASYSLGLKSSFTASSASSFLLLLPGNHWMRSGRRKVLAKSLIRCCTAWAGTSKLSRLV